MKDILAQAPARGSPQNKGVIRQPGFFPLCLKVTHAAWVTPAAHVCSQIMFLLGLALF